jgi:hypothetical protein
MRLCYAAKDIIDNIIGALRLEVGMESRAKVILEWVHQHNVKRWVAIDDADEIRELGENHFVQTDGELGITDANAEALISLLRCMKGDKAAR